MADDEKVQAYQACDKSGCNTTVFGYGDTPNEAITDLIKNQQKHNEEKHGG